MFGSTNIALEEGKASAPKMPISRNQKRKWSFLVSESSVCGKAHCRMKVLLSLTISIFEDDDAERRRGGRDC